MSGLPRSSHALVTGGGRGIGRTIAAAMVGAGATVTIIGRDRATMDAVVAAGDAHFREIADVAEQVAVNAAVAAAAARKPIDILVANAALAELARHNPQGRLVSPAEVADTVLWLCGENASAITGQAIAVAGGEI